MGDGWELCCVSGGEGWCVIGEESLCKCDVFVCVRCVCVMCLSVMYVDVI